MAYLRTAYVRTNRPGREHHLNSRGCMVRLLNNVAKVEIIYNSGLV